jgi:hypothetical protein
MKNLKKLIIDFNSLYVILNEKRIFVKELHCKHDIRDAKKILEMLLENKDIKVFVNNHLNIKNIESLYCQLNDFIYNLNLNNQLPKDINLSLLNRNIKDISIYSPSYCLKKLLYENNINDKEKYHFLNVVSYDKENFSQFISNYIKLKIKKNNITFKEILDDIQNQFKKIDVIYKIKKSENFMFIFNELFKMKLENKFDPLCKDVDDIFSDLIRKIKSKEINIDDIDSEFAEFIPKIVNSIIDNLRIKNNDETLFLNELKKYNNIYDFLLNYEKNLIIHKFIFEKNETLEKRIIEKNREYVAFSYLRNIINKLKKTNSHEKIMIEIQNNFKSIFDIIRKTNFFVEFLLLFKININFIDLINKNNIQYSLEDDFSLHDKKSLKDLVNNYLGLLVNNPKSLFTKHDNLLKIMDLNNFFTQNFSIIMERLDDEKYIEILKNNYSNIYSLYLLGIYTEIQDPIEQLKKIKGNNKLYKDFIEDDVLVIKFLNKLRPIMCSIEIEKFLNNPIYLILYLYIYRKKLSPQSEEIISSNKKAFSLYKELLHDKNIFNNFYDLDDFATYVYENIEGFED